MEMHLEFNEEKEATLQQLMDDLKLTDHTLLINIAISILLWAVKSIKNGKSIASIDEVNMTYRELDVPYSSNIVLDIPPRKKVKLRLVVDNSDD